jgi:hypothetical protein
MTVDMTTDETNRLDDAVDAPVEDRLVHPQDDMLVPPNRPVEEEGGMPGQGESRSEERPGTTDRRNRRPPAASSDPTASGLCSAPRPIDRHQPIPARDSPYERSDQ